MLASLQPESPLHGIEGLKHMATAIVPGIYDPTLADVDLRIDTERAVAMTRRLAREEGLLVGISAGASVAAALALVEPRRRRDRALRWWRAVPLRGLLGGRVTSALTLGPGVLEAIQAHGRETYPHECCGALLGHDGVVRQAWPLPNTTEEGPRRRFLVRPRDYRSPRRGRRTRGWS